MKKNLILILTTAFVAFSSCSNDDDSELSSISSSNDKLEARAQSSAYSKTRKKEFFPEDEDPMLDYEIGVWPSSEVTRMTTTSKKKVLLSSMASGMGMPGTYICDIVKLSVTTDPSDLYVYRTLNDDECGFIPNDISSESKCARGTMVLSNSDGSYTLSTSCVYVRYDLSGRNIKKWTPCSPDEALVKYKRLYLGN